MIYLLISGCCVFFSVCYMFVTRGFVILCAETTKKASIGLDRAGIVRNLAVDRTVAIGKLKITILQQTRSITTVRSVIPC